MVLSFALMDLSLSAWITAGIWIVTGVVVNHGMPGKQVINLGKKENG
jgi:hypothetical protein